MLRYESVGSIENQALVFFHGFLGCKEDWRNVTEFLEKNFYCISIDLPGHSGQNFTDRPIDEIVELLKSFSIKTPVGIGYSLGGRILMQIQKNYPNFFKNYFFLSSHPGIECEGKRKEQSINEMRWKNLLFTCSLENFLSMWYKQPLFENLKNNTSLFENILLSRSKHNKTDLIAAYEYFRLSKQENFQEFQHQSFFFYGEHDKKYQDLYIKRNWQVIVEKILNSGHAVHIENPLECARKITLCLQTNVEY